VYVRWEELDLDPTPPRGSHVLHWGATAVRTISKKVPVHWQIMTFEIFTGKNKTWTYCSYNLLLFINNINVFKQVVCVRAFL